MLPSSDTPSSLIKNGRKGTTMLIPIIVIN
jgi:hypothetical protein